MAPSIRAGLHGPRFAPYGFLVGLAAAWTGSACAGTTDLGNGVEAVWSLTASATGGWRTARPDPDLIGIGDGGSASSSTHSHNKNFGKGGNTSQLLRIVGDVNIRKGDSGLVLRAKAWDNLRYSRNSVSFGAPSNGFTPDSRLDDSQFDTRLSKFNGIELLDAYAYRGNLGF